MVKGPGECKRCRLVDCLIFPDMKSRIAWPPTPVITAVETHVAKLLHYKNSAFLYRCYFARNCLESCYVVDSPYVCA